jgi:hypothetical protein
MPDQIGRVPSSQLPVEAWNREGSRPSRNANGESRMKSRSPVLALTFLMILTAGARASTPDAWEEFRGDVRSKCLERLTAQDTAALKDIRVAPFGSESFGFALMTVIDKQTNEEKSVVCAYGKAGKTAEISEPF